MSEEIPAPSEYDRKLDVARLYGAVAHGVFGFPAGTYCVAPGADAPHRIFMGAEEAGIGAALRLLAEALAEKNRLEARVRALELAQEGWHQ